MLLSIVPIDGEVRVNTFTTSDQSYSSLAMDDSGDFVVVWQSFAQDASGYGIYAQRYNSAGAAQGGEFRVNNFTTNSQRYPAVAMDAVGDFVAVWESAGQDGNFSGVYARRYNSAGVPQGAEFRVNTFTNLSQEFPSVAVDADGDFVVAWQSYQDGSGYGIYAQRYNSAGVPQGGEFRVNTYTTQYQTAASVAMDEDGDFVIAWESFQDGSLNGIYAQRYNSAGVPQGSEFRINAHTTGGQRFPSVAMDATGDFGITWHSAAQDGSGYGIYARRYDSSGVPQGTEFAVNTFTTSEQGLPSVAMDDAGDFVVAWHSSAQDGSGYGIYAQAYSADGVLQGGEFRANTYTTSAQAVPSVAIDADGDLIIAWHSSAQDGSNYGVYAQRYRLVPAVTASDFLLDTSPQRLSFSFDQNVSASLGTDDVVLENLTTMQTIPSSDLALSYDLPTNTATFSYTGNASALSGVLPDGNYRAVLLAAGITNPSGVPLAANHVFNFSFLNGDANHDGRVNLLDFNILAANFGQSPRNFSQGDFNYDTIVNLSDFNILASRFGVALGPQSSGLNAPQVFFNQRQIDSDSDALSKLLD